MRTFLLVAAAVLVAAQDEALTTEVPTENDEPAVDYPIFPPATCRYYCVFKDEPYCCDDNTRPPPPDHKRKPGTCVEMEYHHCEDDGILKIDEDFDVSNATQLFSGNGAESAPCASDGYCMFGEKCCPTPCGEKHLCLKADGVDVKDETEVSTFPPATCRYFCIYNNSSYCCDDNTRPPPPNHYIKPGSCVDEDDHVCKKTEILTSSDVYHGSTKVSKLFSGNPDETAPCASDGYCDFGEKCCPSKCGKKHLCLKADYPEAPPQCRYYCLIDYKYYCCDDGSMKEPKDHSDHPGMWCPPREEECEEEMGGLNGLLKYGDKHAKQKYRFCASDGYCKNDERCCPSNCANRHICRKGIEMKAIDFVL